MGNVQDDLAADFSQYSDAQMNTFIFDFMLGNGRKKGWFTSERVSLNTFDDVQDRLEELHDSWVTRVGDYIEALRGMRYACDNKVNLRFPQVCTLPMLKQIPKDIDSDQTIPTFSRKRRTTRKRRTPKSRSRRPRSRNRRQIGR